MGLLWGCSSTNHLEPPAPLPAKCVQKDSIRKVQAEEFHRPQPHVTQNSKLLCQTQPNPTQTTLRHRAETGSWGLRCPQQSLAEIYVFSFFFFPSLPIFGLLVPLTKPPAAALQLPVHTQVSQLHLRVDAVGEQSEALTTARAERLSTGMENAKNTSNGKGGSQLVMQCRSCSRRGAAPYKSKGAMLAS